jgi:3-deoxy-manno-octulosonate cytidylyltransferase (CMP-KDO synthetase)
MNKTAIIIPSHLAAKRLPNKPLIKIKDKTMITHVWEKAIATKVQDVFVATADKEIADEIQKQGGNAIITGKHHTTGSDRIFEAIQKLKLDHDIIINVQGDMPTINPDTINILKNFMISNPNVSVATVASEIEKEEIKDLNVVKAVTAQELKMDSFSQAKNFVRKINNEEFFYHHIGLYSYKKEVLEKFIRLDRTANEKDRSLEQMRFLDNNIDIFVGYTKDSPLSVDTQEDLEKIRKMI